MATTIDDPEALKRALIEKARAALANIKAGKFQAEMFGSLEKGDAHAKSFTETMKLLAKLGVDEAALDPEGKKTKEEMRKEIGQAFAVCVPRIFAQTKDGRFFNPIVSAGDRIRATQWYVDKTREFNPGFDPDNAHVTTIRNAFRPVLIEKAREMFRDLEKDDATPRNPDTTVLYIRKFLEEVGVGEEALDPAGKASAKEMQARLHAAADRVCIMDAWQHFSQLETMTSPRGNIRSDVNSIINDLKALGVTNAPNPIKPTRKAGLMRGIRRLGFEVYDSSIYKLDPAKMEQLKGMLENVRVQWRTNIVEAPSDHSVPATTAPLPPKTPGGKTGP